MSGVLLVSHVSGPASGGGGGAVSISRERSGERGVCVSISREWSGAGEWEVVSISRERSGAGERGAVSISRERSGERGGVSVSHVSGPAPVSGMSPLKEPSRLYLASSWTSGSRRSAATDRPAGGYRHPAAGGPADRAPGRP